MLTVVLLAIFVTSLVSGNEYAIVASTTAVTPCIIFYFRKAQAENIPKVQTSYYKSVMEIKYEYNAKMMQLKADFGVGNDEFEEDDDAEEMTQEALESGAMRLQDASDDANELVDTE